MNSKEEFNMYAAKRTSRIFLATLFVFSSATFTHLLFFENPYSVKMIMVISNILITVIYVISKKGLFKIANHMMICLVIGYIILMNIAKPGMYRHNFIILVAVVIAALSMKKKIIINYGVITLIIIYVIYFFGIKYDVDYNRKYLVALVCCIVLFTFLEVFNLELLKKSEEIKNKSIKSSFNSTLRMLGHIAEIKDKETHSHLDRVSYILEMLLHELGKHQNYNNYITDPYIKDMMLASTMHDIGKIGVKDSILLKPGKLTTKEFDEIKKHTTEGAAILEDAHTKIEENRIFDLAIEIARHHHERWDGNGYPHKLKGKNIPLSARTVAIADVYDALICDRPYKRAMKHEDAYQLIKEASGSQFDPVIVKCFENIHYKLFARIQPLLYLKNHN